MIFVKDLSYLLNLLMVQVLLSDQGHFREVFILLVFFLIYFKLDLCVCELFITHHIGNATSYHEIYKISFAYVITVS